MKKKMSSEKYLQFKISYKMKIISLEILCKEISHIKNYFKLFLEKLNKKYLVNPLSKIQINNKN